MQSENGAKFLNITCLSFLSGAAGVFAAIVMVPLTNMYTSLQSCKLDFNIAVLNLI